ncbi:MAG: endonuclease III domain-containing protein [Candidatus Micrarchaeota archaeon]|nr:endonuclease III domain-containing protein [Candidatus Micrarchaeota archaeon]
MLIRIYNKLLSHYGNQNWWPAGTRFEVIVGAILTQNTNWKNVEKAISNLKNVGKLNINSIVHMKRSELEELIKPSGFYRQKAERLQSFCSFILDNFGSIESMFKTKPEKLRDIILMQNGIGPETADSILLYAGDLPFFVVDAYTRRLLKRVGIGRLESYEEIRHLFESNLPPDVRIYKEYHALIVELSKGFCKKKPSCNGCPLTDICRKLVNE